MFSMRRPPIWAVLAYAFVNGLVVSFVAIQLEKAF